MSTTSDDFVTKIRRLTLFTSGMRRRSSLAADSSDMPFARRMSMTTFADYLPAFRSMRCRALTLSVSGDFISQSMPPIWMSALFTRIRRSRPRISRPCPTRRESAPSQARAAREARCRVSRLCFMRSHAWKLLVATTTVPETIITIQYIYSSISKR